MYVFHIAYKIRERVMQIHAKSRQLMSSAKIHQQKANVISKNSKFCILLRNASYNIYPITKR